MEERKVIAIISTDWHLQQSNTSIIEDLVKQQIDLSKEEDCTTLLCLGDVFDSRVSQREEVLNAFTDILDMVHANGMLLGCIPGNHDKTDYKSDRSFLDPFYYHPGLVLHRIEGLVSIQGLPVAFIPFYDTDIWLERYELIEQDVLDKNFKEGTPIVLMSHIALNGSVNNDGSKVVSSITPGMLSETFTHVYLGHYHNTQEVAPGIVHLSSIRQNNFGEDNVKGFWVLYNDGEIEFRKSKFTEYKVVKVDLDKTSKFDLVKLAGEIDISNAKVKIEFSGSESKLKSLNEDIFAEKGVIVKKKRKDLDVIDPEIENIPSTLTGSDMKTMFEKFCEEKGYDVEKGYKFLKKYVE